MNNSQPKINGKWLRKPTSFVGSIILVLAVSALCYFAGNSAPKKAAISDVGDQAPLMEQNVFLAGDNEVYTKFLKQWKLWVADMKLCNTMVDSIAPPVDKNLDVLEKIFNAYQKFPNDFPDRLDDIDQTSYEFMRMYTS